MAFGRSRSSYSPPSFLDVPIGYPYYRDVEQFKADGITSGCGYSLFCPDQALTRAAAVTFLLRKLGYTQASCTPEIFTDVPSSFGLCGWVNKAYEIGLTTGCGTNLFCPNDPVLQSTLETYIERIR
jgi:hypothetical protein